VRGLLVGEPAPTSQVRRRSISQIQPLSFLCGAGPFPLTYALDPRIADALSLSAYQARDCLDRGCAVCWSRGSHTDGVGGGHCPMDLIWFLFGPET